MKLRVLISLLFIVATTFTAVHELEHIDDEHGASTCLVCTVSQNLVSADNPPKVFDFELIYTKEIVVYVDSFTLYIKKTDNHSNAPPHLS